MDCARAVHSRSATTRRSSMFEAGRTARDHQRRICRPSAAWPGTDGAGRTRADWPSEARGVTDVGGHHIAVAVVSVTTSGLVT